MTWLLFLALFGQHWMIPAVSGPPPWLNVPRAEQTAPPAAVNPDLSVARQRFAAAVTNGRLRGFDDRLGRVAFKPAHRLESDHRPGPLEDDVIASTLRGCIVADPNLGKLGLSVRSQAGKVVFNGSPNDPGALAKLIVLALGLDGVTRVRADLPASLKLKS